MSAKAFTLSPLGPTHLSQFRYRYEIQDLKTGKYGLAILNSENQWEVSPNMKVHATEIIRRIHELENTSSQGLTPTTPKVPTSVKQPKQPANLEQPEQTKKPEKKKPEKSPRIKKDRGN